MISPLTNHDSLKLSIKQVKTSDDAFYYKLKLTSWLRLESTLGNYLRRYAYYSCENLEILKRIPKETRNKLNIRHNICVLVQISVSPNLNHQ